MEWQGYNFIEDQSRRISSASVIVSAGRDTAREADRVDMTYTNPWAKEYEPKEYTRNIEPVEYNGCQIVKVHPTQYDLVKSGICIAQRWGLEGVKVCADVVADLLFPTFQDVRERMLEKYGHY
jgi:hypothetical protein